MGAGHPDFGLYAMPGQGRAVERGYTSAEREVPDDAVGVLGDATVGVHLNDNARCSNFPVAVRRCKRCAYQLLKSGYPAAKARTWTEGSFRRWRSASPTRRGA